MVISTPKVMFNIFGISITDTIIWTIIIMAFILGILTLLVRNLKVKPEGKPQIVAEFIVVSIRNFVVETMGEIGEKFAPYFLALIAFLGISNISGFLFVGIVRPPTADLATTIGLAMLTFFLTQGFSLKVKGLKGYFKRFFEPMAILFPINLIGELSNPLSLALRLFGNVLGGLIILSLIYSMFLISESVVIAVVIIGLIFNVLLYTDNLDKFNNKLGKIFGGLLLAPILFLLFGHFYFDLFSGLLQSYIFCMLSMVFISMAMD